MLLSLALFTAPSLYAREKEELKDLFYGEALYYIYQDDYFSAIRLLDHELAQHYGVDNPSLDTLFSYRDNAELSIGELELSYRMHQQAGRSLQRLFQEDIDQDIQNTAALRMARILFNKGQHVNAINALKLIRGKQTQAFKNDVAMLRALTEMTQRNFTVAIDLLKPLRNSSKHQHFAQYNLGIAYLLSGKLPQGAKLLDQVGGFSTNDKELLALQDKANLVLGNRYLDEGYAQLAKPLLNKIRIDGPFSNRALLKSGWADIALKNYESAITPWTILHERNDTDLAVQESLLALPYAYSKIESFGRAALLYGEAVERINTEIDKIDLAIDGVNKGRLLEALGKNDDRSHRRFLTNINEVSGTPEVRYLFRLIASNDFNESIKNYRDLLFIEENLEQLQWNIQAYKNIVAIRGEYYQPLIPRVEETFAVLDAAYGQAVDRKAFLEERVKVIQRLHDPRALATEEELVYEDSLLRIERQLARMPEQIGIKESRRRLERLKGILEWRQHSAYDARLESTYKQIDALGSDVETMQNTHGVVVNDKREAYQSFVGYDIPFRRITTRLVSLLSTTKSLLRQQGRFINKVAIIELDKRRKKLSSYQTKARFALAESYDKATQKEVKELEEKIRLDNELKAAENAKPKTEGSVTPQEDAANTNSKASDEKAK